MLKRMTRIRSLLLALATVLFLVIANVVFAEETNQNLDVETSEEETNIYTAFYPEDIPVYGDYETGIAPLSVEDYATGVVTTYKRLDMFNPNSTQGYTVLNTGIKYFSSDNNSADANHLGLKRVVYCIEYSKSSPNTGIEFSYTYSNNNVYRPELYIMANGVRYLNQECVNSQFRTGLGADYDYYVTQMALHLARGEFTYDYFKERMLTSTCSVSDTVKNKVLSCIYDLYAYGVNITTDPCMFYLYGTENPNSILMNVTGATHSLSNVSSQWTKNSDGNWVTPTAMPISIDYYGGDLRPYYRSMTVTTDVSGVNVYQYSLHGGVVSQGFYLYCSDATYKELQKTGATINVTCKLTLPNVFSGRVLDFSVNNGYQDVEYYGSLTDWGNTSPAVTAVYTIPKVETNGKVYVQKSSSDTSFVNGNNCYSLEGAEYTVYADSECTINKGTIITDAEGISNTLELATGTYYVKETKAPKGYILDNTVYTVVLNSSHATTPYVLMVTDIPLSYPISVLLKKVDADTMESTAQGTGTLEGAEFTVKYYDILSGDKDPAESGNAPLKTWVYKTDENGLVYLNDSSYFVSGDELYDLDSKTASIPIGTITIQETKASEGYLLNETVYVVPITEEVISAGISTYAIPIIPEPVFQLKLRKVQADTEICINQSVFEHIRPNGEKETLTTDLNGELSILGLERGTHSMKEISAPDGYLINRNEIVFTVHEDHSVIIQSESIESDADDKILISVNDEGNIEVVVEDEVSPYSIQILKRNNKGMLLQNVEFTVYADETCQTVVKTQVTDKDGKLTIENLVVGETYYLKETKAPAGYKLPENETVYKIYTDAYPINGIFDFYINDIKYSVDDTDTASDIYISGTAADRMIHLEIENALGYVLPETGSFGTLFLILAGTLLIIGALLPDKIIDSMRGIDTIMRNKILFSLLTLSLLCSGVAPVVGETNVYAASYTVENGVVNCGDGAASITIYGNEGQSLIGKQFQIYKLFHVENSAGGESVNYTFNDTYKTALQNVVGEKLSKEPETVTEYDVIDYIQTLNNFKVEGADTDQTLESRYSEFRYFVETLRDEMVSLGCEGDIITINSVNDYNSFQLNGLDYGYYIVDEITSTTSTNAASSLCMVSTANPDTSINIKSDYPTVTKKIQEDDNTEEAGNNGWNDIADYEIGQTVPYKYTSNIPNINGYSTYYYAWHDVMDNALTFHRDSVSIVISDEENSYTLDASEFSVVENPDDDTTFKITIADIKAIIDREFDNTDTLGHNTYGQTVTLTYTAMLNDTAANDTGRPGFENNVRLEFSNNPDNVNEGADIPDDETGFTPWDTVVCFTYQLDVLKTNDKNMPLANAKFRLYSDEECENEVYVKRTDTGYIVMNRDSLGGTDHVGGEATTVAVEMVSDASGTFTIYGLDDGVYYLKETDAPDGYRQILDPIKLTVDASYTTERNAYLKGEGATDKTLVDLAVSADIKLFLNGKYEESSNELITDVENGSANLTVINHVGSKLPITGSVGTIMLIVLGTGAMLAGLKKEKEHK